jgi:hypothetical protein
VHFYGGIGDYGTGGSKNPNFSEMKQEWRKRGFDRFRCDSCRNKGINGTDKDIFAGFQHQNRHK